MNFFLPILVYPLFFLALFIIAEILYWRAGIKAEHTRKLVHAGTGLLTLGFPFFFYSAWQVIIICLLFLVLLIISRKMNLLRSINAVERKTEGSILFPVIVILVFLFYRYLDTGTTTALVNFYLPILIMALCDPLAALVGTSYKAKHPTVTGKTRAGTIAFLITAFIISALLMLAFTNLDMGSIIAWSVLIAVLTALTERISDGGWDNFTIPVAAMAVLYLINYLQ